MSLGDGSVVVGSEHTPGYPINAFIWTQDHGITYIAPLSSYSNAYDVSADGSTVTGEGDRGAFIWSASDGLVYLNDLDPTSTIDAVGVGESLPMAQRL